MRLFRWLLVIGGIFNLIMGTIFLSTRMIAAFFHAALQAELTFFHHTAVLFVPQDPVHLLLVHGFGAAAMILGATLIYSARDPSRWIAFVLFDGIGRLIYGIVMITYVNFFSLPRVILIFGFFELSVGLFYVASCFLVTRD
jgi:hypothetical protein